MTTQTPLMTTLLTPRRGTLLAFLAGAALAGPAQAQVIQPPVTNLNDSGPGSLRQAIENANGNGISDAITFDETLAGGTIVLSSGQLTITDDPFDPDLTIDGDLDDDGTPDITVDAQGNSRVFAILPGASAILEGLVITGGNATVVGAIINDTESTLTVANSTISGNSDSGIFNSFGTVTVEGSTIRGNRSASRGGGIRNFAGTLTVASSTISGNSANTGGGIGTEFGTVTVTNSTISNNSGPDGAGIENDGGMVTVTHSTISGNSTPLGGAIRGTLQIKSTIVAGNSRDCSAPLTSLGFNLDGDGTCGLDAALNDLPNTTNPMLGVLTNNGGPTETHALLEGSPAIDHIPLADCTDAQGNPVETDQQGVERPQPFPDGNCDIGAFELMQEAPLTTADVIELFDDAVDDGALMGAGPGGSGPGRLNALRNMLLAAGDLLEQGEVDDACTQLQDAANRTDGDLPPPDFARGDAADELFDAITEVQDEFGCFA